MLYMNVLATWTYISNGNRVFVAGTTASLYCYSYSTQPYWHYYSLTSRPCTFGSVIYSCPSAARSSLSYPYSSSRNRTTLTIRRMEMSDAGTYICSGSRYFFNPYLSTASSIIVGVIGKWTLVLPSNRLNLRMLLLSYIYNKITEMLCKLAKVCKRLLKLQPLPWNNAKTVW